MVYIKIYGEKYCKCDAGLTQLVKLNRIKSTLYTRLYFKMFSNNKFVKKMVNLESIL